MVKNLDFFNIEVGTFRRKGQKLVLTIDRNQFRYDKLAELSQLKQEAKNFLPLSNIIEQDNKVIFTYELTEKLRSLKTIKSENKAIRTAIAEKIMNQDILNSCDDYVSLNPANIWFYPMSHVWYAYRANTLMPSDDKHGKLVQYKALILYCLTGIPFEKLLSNLKEAVGNKDELLQQIVNAKSVEELKRIVKEMNDYVTYEEWQAVNRKQNKFNKKLWISVASVALIAIILIGLVHKKDERNLNYQVEQQQAKIVRLKYTSNIQNALKAKHWKTANNLMNKAGYSKDKQAEIYLKHTNYQQALKIKPTKLNTIVNLAYKNGDKKKIVDWKLPTSASKTVKNNLKLEQAILNYDTTVMNNQLAFTTNSDQLLRMGKAYLAHNDTQDTQTVVTKLTGTKAKYMKALINLKSDDGDIDSAQKKLDDANKIDGNKDKKKDDKVKAAQSNLTSAKAAKTADKKKVKNLQKKVGD